MILTRAHALIYQLTKGKDSKFYQKGLFLGSQNHFFEAIFVINSHYPSLLIRISILRHRLALYATNSLNWFFFPFTKKTWIYRPLNGCFRYVSALNVQVTLATSVYCSKHISTWTGFLCVVLFNASMFLKKKKENISERRHYFIINKMISTRRNFKSEWNETFVLMTNHLINDAISVFYQWNFLPHVFSFLDS